MPGKRCATGTRGLRVNRDCACVPVDRDLRDQQRKDLGCHAHDQPDLVKALEWRKGRRVIETGGAIPLSPNIDGTGALIAAAPCDDGACQPTRLVRLDPMRYQERCHNVDRCGVDIGFVSFVRHGDDDTDGADIDGMGTAIGIPADFLPHQPEDRLVDGAVGGSFHNSGSSKIGGDLRFATTQRGYLHADQGGEREHP